MSTDNEPIDFTCQKCGKDALIAPDPPARAICPDCCEDHEFRYDPWLRGNFCVYCDKEQELGDCWDDV